MRRRGFVRKGIKYENGHKYLLYQSQSNPDRGSWVTVYSGDHIDEFDQAVQNNRLENEEESEIIVSTSSSRDYLRSIKNIRRLDWVDGDVSVIWDPFVMDRIKNEIPLHFARRDGVLAMKHSREDLVKVLTETFDLKLAVTNTERSEKDQKISSEMHILTGKNVLIHLTFWNTVGYSNLDVRYEANGVGLGFLVDDEEASIKINTICDDYIECVKKATGSIYVLKSTASGIALGEVSHASEKLIPDNYSSKVIDQYSHMMEDLKCNKPCGRLSVVSGIPGAGKSYLLKSMLNHSEDIMFILVRPELVTRLGDPDFVSVLLDQREDDKPFVFVVEDADSILTERMADNMGGISAILNTSDGILGSSLDLRIVATTNAKKMEFDSAVLRPGRLCTHIEVDKVTTEHAHKIFHRETNKTLKEAEIEITADQHLAARAQKIGFGRQLDGKNSGYTLAEVYKAIYLYNKTIDKK